VPVQLCVNMTVTVRDSEWEAELVTYGLMKPRLNEGGRQTEPARSLLLN